MGSVGRGLLGANMPVRIQRRRVKGWKMPEGAVYVGRPTKWGNKFRVGGHYKRGAVGEGIPRWQMSFLYLEAAEGYQDSTYTTIGCRTEAVEWCRWYYTANWSADERWAMFAELRGKDLACWCPLHQPCHADVLLELANAARAGEDQQP